MFALLTLCTFLACRKGDELKPTPNPYPIDSTTTLNVLWQQAMNPADTFDYLSMQAMFYGDNVIFSRADYTAYNEPILAFDRLTGAKKWEWQPEIKPALLGTHRNSAFLFDEALALNYARDLYSINAITGQINWGYTVPAYGDGIARAAKVGNYLYHVNDNSLIADTSSYFVRTSISSPKWDTIYTLQSIDNYSPGFEMPGVWINPAGDTILILQNRQWNFPASDGKIDLWALNLRTRKPEWVDYDIEPSGNSSVRDPYIYENRVYFLGLDRIMCFDVTNGAKIWERTFPGDNTMVGDILIVEGKLFVKPTNDGNLYALNPNTGNIIYKVPKTGYSNVTFEYHKGRIYFCTSGEGKLYGIQVSDGKVILNAFSPNYHKGSRAGSAYMTGSVKIDQDRNLLYTEDSFYYLCIKLPD